ncbi:hypothetical protein GOARA_021_00640 [Gordonia araii NBRC 100433]|uniref:ABC transporter permease protein n=1 Tax=Gordonia araii NBRC 100433 TaxID=1073574 RepID=G7GZ02_9ACTN|nr:hypothetical protein [Gordonia araii]NNG97036.1 hypothetical protein [Gordonia araii NBRC 100433]GAB08827.1 hypothetical protein GOARA_021_00640 [Gordonia araii NBRC 100433]
MQRAATDDLDAEIDDLLRTRGRVELGRLQPPPPRRVATLAVLGVGFGVTARDVGSIAEGPSGMRKLLEEFNSDAVDGFLAVSTLLLALAATGAAIALALSLRSEELSGRADLVLAGTVQRWRLPMLHIALAVMAGLWLLLVIGATIGASHGFGSGDAGQLPRLVGAALGQLPAVVFFIGLTVAAVGLVPKFSWLPWVVLAESAIVTIVGPPMNLPTAVMNLSVFHHVPRLPGVAVDATPSLILLASGVALAAVGVLAFARRDLE